MSKLRDKRWRVITKAVFMTGMIMAGGFMAEELLLGTWPWWAWGLTSLVCMVGLVATETWPWFRSSPKSKHGALRQAHREAVREVRETVKLIMHPKSMFVTIYLTVIAFFLLFLVAFFSGRPLLPGWPYWGQP
ncbi:MAG: hypothetical protein F4151_10185 [Gammaproteobacteria bacterium]|nr:hypothetical protein [Gammaproteobacteria bacterium]